MHSKSLSERRAEEQQHMIDEEQQHMIERTARRKRVLGVLSVIVFLVVAFWPLADPADTAITVVNVGTGAESTMRVGDGEWVKRNGVYHSASWAPAGNEAVQAIQRLHSYRRKYRRRFSGYVSLRYEPPANLWEVWTHDL